MSLTFLCFYLSKINLFVLFCLQGVLIGQEHIKFKVDVIQVLVVVQLELLILLKVVYLFRSQLLWLATASPQHGISDSI